MPVANPRNRVIYQSEALYAGPTPVGADHIGANAPSQLQRVQSANYSFNIERQDVNQFGELASIDRVILSAPTVALDFSYLVANLYNESAIGFHVLNSSAPDWVSCISGVLNKESDEKNYFIRTTDEGSDALGIGKDVADQRVIGIGNGFVTSYTTEGSVGNFPTASVNVEALNMKVDNAISGKYLPSVNPINGNPDLTYVYGLNPVVSTTAADATTVLRPGQITLDLKDGGTATDISVLGADINDAKIQSYNISFDLGRTPLEKLGSKFAFAREIDFPVTITMSVEASVGDLVTGNLADILGPDSSYDLTVNLKDKDNAVVKAAYHIKEAKLDSQEFSSAVGDNKSVTLNFSAQVGGPAQNNIGFFMSGVI
jgi:hypothetical protein